MSESVCEVCGKPATKFFGTDFSAGCDDHPKGHQSPRAEADHEHGQKRHWVSIGYDLAANDMAKLLREPWDAPEDIKGALIIHGNEIARWLFEETQ